MPRGRERFPDWHDCFDRLRPTSAHRAKGKKQGARRSPRFAEDIIAIKQPARVAGHLAQAVEDGQLALAPLGRHPPRGRPGRTPRLKQLGRRPERTRFLVPALTINFQARFADLAVSLKTLAAARSKQRRAAGLGGPGRSSHCGKRGGF